ncbi:MAG: hypothetical protein WAU24_09670 [Chitinophagaceae bacterium]
MRIDITIVCENYTPNNTRLLMQFKKEMNRYIVQVALNKPGKII